MKALQFIAAAILVTFLTGCATPNEPVQTATTLVDTLPLEETPGTTQLKADSIQASPDGPTQMVPENSTATQTVSSK